MSYLHSDVLDNGLSVISGATGLAFHICHTEPTTRAQALTYSVGNKASPGVTGPANRTPDGRKVSINTFNDGSVTATSTGASDDAQYWALIDGTRLLAAGALSASQMVTSGNTFGITAALDIGIPGVA